MKKYYFVEPCPRCDSDRTGYFIYCSDENSDRIIAARMKKGELVQVRNRVRDPADTNCFCLDCKAEWHGKIQTQYLTEEEILKEKELRGITDELIESKKNERDNYRQKHKVTLIKKIERLLVKLIK